MNFTNLTIVMAAVLAGWAYILMVLAPKKPELWKTLPREKVIGAIVGAICLYIVKGPAELMLEGDLAEIKKYIPYVIPVVVVGSYFFLDFIFMRAFGGLLVLLSCCILDAGFIEAVPARWILNVFIYGWGIVGLFLLGMPWLGRDTIEKAGKDSKYRLIRGGATICSVAIVALFALISLL